MTGVPCLLCPAALLKHVTLRNYFLNGHFQFCHFHTVNYLIILIHVLNWFNILPELNASLLPKAIDFVGPKRLYSINSFEARGYLVVCIYKMLLMPFELDCSLASERPIKQETSGKGWKTMVCKDSDLYLNYVSETHKTYTCYLRGLQ